MHVSQDEAALVRLDWFALPDVCILGLVRHVWPVTYADTCLTFTCQHAPSALVMLKAAAWQA